jgi:hypothetical protein
MSLPQRQIRVAEPVPVAPKISRRMKAEFESHMTMIRCLVDESDNRETDEYLFRTMMQQCKILAKRSGLRVE